MIVTIESKKAMREPLRVLLAEDEFVVRIMLAEMLEEMGCTIVGPAATVEQAARLCEKGGIDLALLDVNLNNEEIFPVADTLRRMSVPIIFSTGYAMAGLPDHWIGAALLQKPYGQDDLNAAIRSLLSRANF